MLLSLRKNDLTSLIKEVRVLKVANNRKSLGHWQRDASMRALWSDRQTMRLLNALNSEDSGLKVRFSLAMIVFETFELILCQMLSSQGKNAPSNPYPHYLVRLATSRFKRIRRFSDTWLVSRHRCPFLSGCLLW